MTQAPGYRWAGRSDRHPSPASVTEAWSAQRVGAALVGLVLLAVVAFLLFAASGAEFRDVVDSSRYMIGVDTTTLLP